MLSTLVSCVSLVPVLLWGWGSRALLQPLIRLYDPLQLLLQLPGRLPQLLSQLCLYPLMHVHLGSNRLLLKKSQCTEKNYAQTGRETLDDNADSRIIRTILMPFS